MRYFIQLIINNQTFKVMKKKLLRVIIMTSFYSVVVMVLQAMAMNLLFALPNNAQEVKSVRETYVSVDFQNYSLITVFEQLEEKTGFKFSYDDKHIDRRLRIDLNGDNVTLEQVLLKLSKEAHLKFRQINKVIDVGKRVRKGEVPLNVEVIQSRTVTGQVTATDAPQGLPGVNVILKGTSTGTVSDIDGNYSIDVPSDESVLVFSSVGYVQEEVPVGNQSVINMSLTPDITALEEIVVVGYGSQKRAEISGSISTVDGEELTKTNALSANEALQGRAAGVNITSSSGQPGGAVTVRVRGGGNINASDPLYVIDGQIVGGGPEVVFAQEGLPKSNDTFNPLSNLNPNDIESIRVLKDASTTAIYGARAANGVVLITTKKGTTTGVPKLSYRGSVGFSNNTNLLEFLDTRSFMERMNEQYENAGQPVLYPNIDAAIDTLGNTDWTDELFRTGFQTDHNLAVQGGNEKFNYYSSLNYNQSEGTIIGTGFERLNLRFNSDAKINDRLNVGNRLFISGTNTRGVRNALGQPGFFDNRESTVSFVNLGVVRPPVFKVKHEDGSWAGTNNPSLDLRPNPVALVARDDQKERELSIMGNVFVEVEPIKNFKIKSTGSIQVNNNYFYGFVPLYEEDLYLKENSDVRMDKSTTTLWTWDNTANYRFKLGNKHNFSLMAGVSATEWNLNAVNGSSQWDDNEFREVGSNATTSILDSELDTWSLSSVFGRFHYNFDGKYLLTANIRRDGSSKFGPQNRYGTFPSISLGWWLSDEGFFPENDIVSKVKLRGGYGEVGSDAIPAFQYLPTLRGDFGYPFNDASFSQALVLNGIATPGLMWETTKDFNLGMDLIMFNDHVTFTAEYYSKKQTDALLSVPIPPTSGFENILTNTGEAENKGVDLSLEYQNQSGELDYSFTANFSHYKSQVNKLGVGQEQIFVFNGSSGQSAAVMRPGEVLGAFYGFVTEGIFQTQAEVDAANELNPDEPYQSAATAPGDFRYKDLDGNGVVNSQDQTVIGNPHPDFTLGFNGSIYYKQFDFSFLLYASVGNEIYNLNRVRFVESGRGVNKVVDVKNAWDGPGTSNTIPRAHQTDPNQNTRWASHLIEDGSYLRLRNLQIGYTLPESVMGKAFSNARIFVSGQNLLTFTGYSGYDPEIGAYRGISAATGIDQSIYPNVRSYRLGVTIDF